MKTAHVIALSLITGGSILGFLSYGDDNQQARGTLTKVSAREKAEAITSEKLEMALTVKDYLHTEVVNREGVHLGTVVDLILRGKDGAFEKLVLSSGGILGLGGKLVAVPYDKVEQKPGTSKLVWDIPKEDFLGLIGKQPRQARETKLTGARNTKVYQSPKGSAMVASRGVRLNEERRGQEAEAKAIASTELADRVKAELKRDPAIAAKVDHLTLAIEGRKIVLQGEVESAAEKKRIIQLASKATDAEIVDQLTVAQSVTSAP